MKAGVHPDPTKSPFDPTSSIYRRFPLLRTMKRPAAKVNLLTQEAKTESKLEPQMVPYWYPEITINLVNTEDHLDVASFPAFLRRYIYADRIRNLYYPILYVNEFWELKARRMPLVEGSKHKLPLRITFSSTSFLKFQVLAHLDHLFKAQEVKFGHNSEVEQLKRMFLETAPWLIVVTAVITSLHMIFDFLAFKNGKFRAINETF